jgi:hypothetical protein
MAAAQHNDKAEGDVVLRRPPLIRQAQSA